jgi:hypothetical protein
MKPAPPPPLRIELIAGSMRCFALGIFSLLPILGLPIAVLVLAMRWRIGRRARGFWNPAALYLHWGCQCASWGTALSSLVAIGVGMSIALAYDK